MMASAASVSQAYEEFEAETQALAVRFQLPMPTSSPFSVSCPPLHEDSRLMLVVLLQNAWARFCEDLLVSLVFGSGPTLGGKHLSEIAIPPESASTISHFRKLKGEVAHELPWQNDYPIWHNPEYVDRDSPDQTNFPGNSSFWDTVKYNPAFQGRQMRPDSLKFPVFI